MIILYKIKQNDDYKFYKEDLLSSNDIKKALNIAMDRISEVLDNRGIY